MKNNKADIYWKKNLKYLTILLSIWFTVSFGFGVILVDQLNEFQFFGLSLAFGLLSRDPFILSLF
tara:strand:+ start:126 stop:320 length:195 start_codon:yes stop_codon:yes gene_type:complete